MAFTTPRTWTDGELVTAAIMNPHVRDNFNVVPHRIPKTADQSVTSSTALVDDSTLQFAIGANEAWEFEFVLATTGPGFLKVALNSPSGSTGWWYHNRADSGVMQSNDNSSATFVDGEIENTTATPDMVRITGFVLNSSTSGTFKLRWAQVSSNGTATVVRRGSSLTRRLVA